MSSNLTEQELTTVCFRDPQWLALVKFYVF